MRWANKFPDTELCWAHPSEEISCPLSSKNASLTGEISTTLGKTLFIPTIKQVRGVFLQTPLALTGAFAVAARGSAVLATGLGVEVDCSLFVSLWLKPFRIISRS